MVQTIRRKKESREGNDRKWEKETGKTEKLANEADRDAVVARVVWSKRERERDGRHALLCPFITVSLN